MTLPRLTLERRRALELLATIPNGVNEELLIHGQGFKRQTLVGLIRVGLATAEREVMTADGKPVEVVRIWIRARGGGRSKSDARSDSFSTLHWPTFDAGLFYFQPVPQ